MGRFFYVLSLCLLLVSVKTTGQTTVLDPNDTDVIFTSSYQPAAPSWGVISKWGHTNRLDWKPFNYGYKSYIFRGMAFRLKFPKTYQPGVNDGKKYPCFIFLHGLGEPGPIYDNENQLLWGGQLHAQHVDNGDFDGFLLYPQSTGGWLTSYRDQILALLDSMKLQVKLDEDRVIISGLSSGGQAAWDYVTKNPERWATGSIISAINTQNAGLSWLNSVLSIPIWIANGGQDTGPYPASVTDIVNAYNAAGGSITQYLYPDQGHGVWSSYWAEPGYFNYLATANKTEPIVLHQRTEYCLNDTISDTLLLQGGFYAYQWQKNGVTIPGANANTLVVTDFGSYVGRYQRTASSNWSDWSPTPIVISQKTPTQTPPIQIDGLHSKVLPAPDGSTTVPLMVPSTYVAYDWRRISDNTQVSTTSKYIAPVGSYKVMVTEQYGCSSSYSAPFNVVNANGVNGPDKASNVTATATSNTTVEVDWNENPTPQFNETGFEIYRSNVSGGSYVLVGIVGANVDQFSDSGLAPNVKYYYVVRAVNDNAASPLSNEASVTTPSDNTPPSIPQGLTVQAVSRHMVTLGWQASTDNSGIKMYEIYMNGGKAYTTTDTQFVINGLDSFVNYSFYVKAVDIAGNKSGASSQVIAFTKVNGLDYRVYQGTWSNLPDFTQLTPVLTGQSANIDLSVSPYTVNYGMVWEGYIYVPQQANYTFYLESDDGSAMFLDNWYSPTGTRFINNDGLHGTITVQKTINNLTAGMHKVAFIFFQQGGGQDMKVYWSWNKSGHTTQTLIPDLNFKDQNTASGTVPAQPTNLTATAPAYNLVQLQWVDKSNNETGFELYRKLAPQDFVMVARLAPGATSFQDTTVSGGTTYTYKVQAVNDNGPSGFNQSGVNVTTPAAPPIPAVPQNVSLTILSTSSSQLSFTDNSNQTGYEIYRSMGNANNFKFYQALSTTATSVVVTDSSLYPNQLVYYKVRAIGVSGSSQFSSVVSGQTLNTNPVLTRMRDMSVYFSGTTQVPVSAFDSDGDILTFTFTGLPSFATFNAGTNGNGNLVFTTVPANAGLYPIKIKVTDGFGGADSMTVKITVSSNRPPTLGRIADIVMNEGDVLNKKISAFDPDRFTYLKFELNGAPSFMQGRVSDAYYLVANPGYADAGTYKFWVVVMDGMGGFDSLQVNLLVNNATPPPGYDDGTVPRDPTNFVASALPNGSILLGWNDIAYNEDGYSILRSESASGSYTLINPGMQNANTTNYVDSLTKSNKTYFYKIVAFNSHGHSDTVGIASATTANRPPVINSLANVFVKSGNQAVVNIIATDDSGEALTLQVNGLPSFGSFQGTGNGTGTITLNPQVGNEGFYNNITIQVTDPYGATASTPLSVTVSDNSVRSVFINLGPGGGVPEPAPWNNYLAYPFTSNVLSNLMDDMNTNTGFSFNFTTQLSGTSTFGLTDAGGGIFSDNVLQSALRISTTSNYSMRFSGLSTTKKYNIGILSSLNGGALDSASFTSGGKTVYINGRYNTTSMAQLNGLTPNASGNIDVTFNTLGSTTDFLLNALVLEEYSGTPVIKAANLFALPTVSTTSSNAVQLVWRDRSDSETGVEIYRADSRYGSYTKIATAAANATSYLDNSSSLVADNTYFYKVRVARNTTYSDYSNIARVSVAKNRVLLNMNASSQYNAPLPWNNTNEPSSAAGVTVANLVNTNQVNTGDQFQITMGFNGVGFPGVTPGILPDNVMYSDYWTDAAQVSQAKFSYLDQTKKYRVGVMSSVNRIGIFNGIYTVNGVSKPINGYINSTKMLFFDNISPDENGEIYISVTPDANSPYVFTSAIILEGYNIPAEDIAAGQSARREPGLEPVAMDVVPAGQTSRTAALLPGKLKMDVYPNPASTDINLSLQLPEDAKGALIEMFDVSGKVVLRKSFDGFAGSQLLHINLDPSLARGTYIVKLTANTIIKTLMVIKR